MPSRMRYWSSAIKTRRRGCRGSFMQMKVADVQGSSLTSTSSGTAHRPSLFDEMGWRSLVTRGARYPIAVLVLHYAWLETTGRRTRSVLEAGCWEKAAWIQQAS